MRSEPTPRRGSYCYVLKVDDEVVLHDFTNDLARKLNVHRRRWPNAQIEQIGEPVTHYDAFQWKRTFQLNAHGSSTVRDIPRTDTDRDLETVTTMQSESRPRRRSYCYVLKVDDEVVLHDFTNDLARKLNVHRRRWPNAQIEQIGEPMTHSEAFTWKQSYRSNENQNA